MSRKRKQDDPEQSKRFIATAREIEVDVRPETFERAFKKVARRVENPREAPRIKRSPS